MTAGIDRLKAALADRYVIERELGSGGMATVYAARDLRHDRNVALKVLKPEVAAALGFERFLLEIKVAARLSHPHILPLHDSGRTGGQADRRTDEFLYYVMPIAAGESLRTKLNREGQLSVDAICGLAKEIGGALDYAHSQGVIHRDIKPENILFHHGIPMIADFGIALAVKEAGGERLTGTGISVGTPQYMSPEQVSGDRQLDARSDVYALGCVLYEALVGEPPFTGPSAIAVMARQVTDPVRPIATVRPDVPQHLVSAVNRALAKVPADRFDSAGHLAVALATPEPQPKPAPQVFKTDAPPRRTIAVLPFSNLSADPENEYFSDGITDEMINLLSKLPDLRVTARTSAFAFKGEKHDIREIADKLSVGSILEGSVRRSGNQLRVAVQLVDVGTGSTTWSDRFDREMADVFAIQDEIASAIAQSLSSTFFPSDKSAEKSAPSNLEAYDAYLKGRFHWAQGSVTGVQKSIQSYEHAIELDPVFAAAYAGLALSYSYLTFWLMAPQYDSIAKLRSALEKALFFDDTQADAHAGLGYLKMIADWDWAGAKSEFERAIELKPNSATAYHQYSVLLANLGFADEAIETSKRAVELDPLYAGAVQTLGYSYMAAGDFSRAVELQLKTLQMEPTNFGAHVMLPVMYTGLGKHQDAISAGEHGIATLGRLPFLLGHVGYAYARAGKQEKALRLLDELRERSETEYVPSFCSVMIHLGLGDPEETLNWLEKSFEERSPLLVILPHWYEWDRYRDNPRFQRIYKAIGFDKHAAPRAPTSGAVRTDAKKSIVVLPFANLSPDLDNEYFADGLTEEIITDLSQVRDLLVISRSSAMTLKGTNKGVKEIAKQVNVRYVLEGSVRKAGNNLRITAQLIDAATDAHLWAQKYSGTFDDVFEIQENVSRAIVDALKIELTTEEDQRMAARPIENMEAYEFYLRARAAIGKWTEDGMNEAVRYFQLALDATGENALLLSGLAHTHFSLMNLGVAMEENRAKALELVHRALASDPEMPKVQALLGYLKIMYTGTLADVKEAANHLRRALVSDPSEPDALWALSVVHMYAGRASAAYALAEKLRQVEPLGTYALWILPAVHLFDGRYDLALAEFRRLYDLDPMNPGWGPWLALALAYEGQIDEAAALIDERARLTPEDNHTKLSLMQICGLKGDTQIVSDLLAGPFREWCWSERVWASRVATAYALLNEREEALVWLEHAVDIGFINYPWLAERDRWLENIRGEEDFKELMVRVKKEWEEFEV